MHPHTWYSGLHVVIVVGVVALRLPGGFAAESPMEVMVPQAVHADMADAQPAEPGDAGPAAPGTLALNELIEAALANNPDVSMRQHDVYLADAQREIARSAHLPTIELSGSLAQFREERLINPRRPGAADSLLFADQLLAGDVTLRLPLYSGGRLTHESRAAQLRQSAAGHLLARSREELVFEVTRVFYRMLAQRHAIEALAFSKEALQEHCRCIRERIQAHKAANVDLLRTEVRLSELEQQLTRERNVQSISYRLLATLTGLPSVAAGRLPPMEEALPGTATPPDLQEGLLLAMRNRADFMHARDLLAAQDRNVAAARARRLPEVALAAGYGNQWDAQSTDEYNEIGHVTLQVHLPVFEGGRIDAGIKAQQAARASAEDRLRRLELQIQLDVETAVLNTGSAAEQIQLAGKSIEQAQESLRIERDKYAFAKGSITDVLDAQSALLNAQMNYYRAQSEYHIATAQYRLATGQAF